MLAAFLVLCCVYVCYNVGRVSGMMLCSTLPSCWLFFALIFSRLLKY